MGGFFGPTPFPCVESRIPPSSPVNHKMGREHAGVDIVVACLVHDCTPEREWGRRKDVWPVGWTLKLIAVKTGNGIGHVCGKCGVSRPHFITAFPSCLSYKPAQPKCRQPTPSWGLHPTNSFPSWQPGQTRLFCFYELSKWFHPLQVILSLKETYLEV